MPNIDLLAYFSPWFCLDCILLEHSHDGSCLLPHYNDLISSTLDLVEVLNEPLKQKPLVAEVFDVFGIFGKSDTEYPLRTYYFDIGMLNQRNPVEFSHYHTATQGDHHFPIFAHLHRPF